MSVYVGFNFLISENILMALCILPLFIIQLQRLQLLAMEILAELMPLKEHYEHFYNFQASVFLLFSVVKYLILFQILRTDHSLLIKKKL